MDIRITHTTKTGSTHEHITFLGTDTQTWTLAQGVSLLDSGLHTMFVQQPGTRRTEVRVKQGAYKRFLQTDADGDPRNNLLNLPACQVAAA